MPRCLSLPEAMIEFVCDRPGHYFRYSLSCDKIHRLGWKPQVGFEEGLQKTIYWYKANESWWRPLVDSQAVVGPAWRVRSIALPSRCSSQRIARRKEGLVQRLAMFLSDSLMIADIDGVQFRA